MADFIAVIRRAVDGLSDNTPEMRLRVYDRARSAVQRQLDNMKPRPAEDVIARQMDKLDEAIAVIEAEYGGGAAEPEFEEPAVAEIPAPIPEPVAEPEPEPPAPVAAHHEPEPKASYNEPHEEAEPAPVEHDEPEPYKPSWEREPVAEPPAVEPAAEDDDTMPPPDADEEPLWSSEPEPFREPAFPEPVHDLPRDHAREAPAHDFGVAPRVTPPAPAWTAVVDDNPFREPAEIFTPEPATTRSEERRNPAMPASEPAKWDARPTWNDVNTYKPDASEAQDASWDSFETFVGTRSEPIPEKPAEARSQPKPEAEREGRGRMIGAIVAALIVLVGAGYAGWRFSDSILGFINGSGTTQQASKSTAPAQQQSTAKPQSTPATQPVATAPQKFTQRLMPDGSEVDTGTQGEVAAKAGQTEGQSIASQNEKPAAPAPAPQSPATPAPATEQPASATSGPVKMFLYEERLGQASPTAIEGTVTWSVKNDDQAGHNQKMIQGDISVPGRKMSAIFTLRRNTDATLPASHIIELTFSLPKDFEGRGIESVLRISMKDKEQEQGNPLIAVPAKITDYFHMIALNAYDDAVKTNLDLLKNRDWIDIPMTYSNGRRALLTLQKGPEGQKVFDDVISSWSNTPSDVPIPSAPPSASGSTAPAPDAVPTPTPPPAQ